MDRTEIAGAYYEALDEHAYEQLSELLAEDIRHVRPDRIFDGRDAFVRFMHEERPQPDTSHVVNRVFEPDGADHSVAVQGTLVDDGTEITGFVDVFSFESGRIATIETYIDRLSIERNP